MRISKPYLRSTSIQCYLCLLLNSHFLTEAGIHVFIFSCISAGLPKTEANWQDVISDLKMFETLIQPNCKVTAMHCFLLEWHVIEEEANNTAISETVHNLLMLANKSLSSNGNITESGCKQCEELEEKNVKEFLRSFVHIVQMFINTSWLHLVLFSISAVNKHLPIAHWPWNILHFKHAARTFFSARRWSGSWIRQTLRNEDRKTALSNIVPVNCPRTYFVHLVLIYYWKCTYL